MTERTEQTIKVNIRFFRTSTQNILADSAKGTMESIH